MLRFQAVSVVHRVREGEVRSLDRLALEVRTGEFVVVRGPSGCGKTTLLLCAGGMLRPRSGTVAVGGQDVYALNPAERARFRAAKIGFVFQLFHLIPYLDAVDNILLASAHPLRPPARQRATEWLGRLGLESRRHHKPAALSVGERQRIAVARALFNEPALLLADEPTGNLDPANAAAVLGMFREYNQRGGTVVLATHGPVTELGPVRVVEMRDGRIID